MALDLSEKHQSQIHWPPEQLDISEACIVRDKCFFA